ncbi:unnamed protein product [Coccothraustes coccothraustes]
MSSARLPAAAGCGPAPRGAGARRPSRSRRARSAAGAGPGPLPRAPPVLPDVAARGRLRPRAARTCSARHRRQVASEPRGSRVPSGRGGTRAGRSGRSRRSRQGRSVNSEIKRVPISRSRSRPYNFAAAAPQCRAGGPALSRPPQPLLRRRARVSPAVQRGRFRLHPPAGRELSPPELREPPAQAPLGPALGTRDSETRPRLGQSGLPQRQPAFTSWESNGRDRWNTSRYRPASLFPEAEGNADVLNGGGELI